MPNKVKYILKLFYYFFTGIFIIYFWGFFEKYYRYKNPKLWGFIYFFIFFVDIAYYVVKTIKYKNYKIICKRILEYMLCPIFFLIGILIILSLSIELGLIEPKDNTDPYAHNYQENTQKYFIEDWNNIKNSSNIIDGYINTIKAEEGLITNSIKGQLDNHTEMKNPDSVNAIYNYNANQYNESVKAINNYKNFTNYIQYKEDK
ncbi:MAG: hypothetical protein Ta2D_07250 [Rickettsiales bacterium]|nr:MAG: hypothetical protein Ta2D_07250 [Rickettsiales bacterium]